jgi:hypothetical protein
MRPVREAGPALAETRQRGRAAGWVASHQDQARAHAGQPLRRDLADAGRRPGDHHRFTVHGSSVYRPGAAAQAL